ncbi:MAG: hypothetical protein KC464_18625, partial [Myxococcales bacterium]|nr:hypothetical protein [Myxococcales bacterium]
MGFDVRHGHAAAGRAAIPEATHAEATPAQKASAAKNVADNIDRIQSSFSAAIHEMEECGTAGDRDGWLNGHRKATATLAQLGRLAASAPEA